MDKSIVIQGKHQFLHVVKKVSWLVDNTTVSVFDPINFEGYQRELNENHWKKIMKYLDKKFYLPTPIICACDESYNEDTKLRIVDGQHRVEAFRNLQIENSSRFNDICDFDISVIIMENVPLELEIDTFITINKTSKKVDTSLAYVLKNKLQKNDSSSNLEISKYDYLAVELAVKMNEENELWKNKISFTGSPRKTDSELISLNAFVKAIRRLIRQIDKSGFIDINWSNKEQIGECLNEVENVVSTIWISVEERWPGLFRNNNSEYLKIIQGPIGFSSICRFISNEIKDLNTEQLDTIIKEGSLNEEMFNWINNISVNEEMWYIGNKYSKLTSESGYNIIAWELKESLKY